jgi:hypothetical protein
MIKRALFVVCFFCAWSNLFAQKLDSTGVEIIHLLRKAEKQHRLSLRQTTVDTSAAVYFRLATDEYEGNLTTLFAQHGQVYRRQDLFTAMSSDSLRKDFEHQHERLMASVKAHFSVSFFDKYYWSCVRLVEISAAETIRAHRNLFYQIKDPSCACTGVGCAKRTNTGHQQMSESPQEQPTAKYFGFQKLIKG